MARGVEASAAQVGLVGRMNSRRHSRLRREQRSRKFWKAFNRIGQHIREESDKAIIDALIYGTGAVRIDVEQPGEGLTVEKLIRAKRILLDDREKYRQTFDVWAARRYHQLMCEGILAELNAPTV